jgi:hypothetical protein
VTGDEATSAVIAALNAAGIPYMLVQANHIDWDYVYKWCDEHGTRALLDTIRASIPPI